MSPFRSPAPWFYLCPGILSLGQLDASLDFLAGIIVPGYLIYAMNHPSAALTPGYMTSPSVLVDITGSLAYTHVMLESWGFFSPPPPHTHLWKLCSVSVPLILGYLQLFHFTVITNQNTGPCTTDPGMVVLNSFCLPATYNSSSRSRPFILLQLVQVTRRALFINGSLTHSCWFLSLPCHLFWQMTQLLYSSVLAVCVFPIQTWKRI